MGDGLKRAVAATRATRKRQPPPIDRAAVTAILDRARAALRAVDCNSYLDGSDATRRQTRMVTDAIAAIEAFAAERGIKLGEK